MSLDGFIAGPNGENDWIVMDPDIDFADIALFGGCDRDVQCSAITLACAEAPADSKISAPAADTTASVPELEQIWRTNQRRPWIHGKR